MSSEPRPGTSAYGVVVPLKPPAIGKSRLAGLGDAARQDLVTALALDTVAAVARCPAVHLVLVVTDDVGLATQVRELSVSAVPDGATGLNASLRQGAAEVVRRAPGLRLAALCGDLPCLGPRDLEAVLGSAPDERTAFVSDAAGIGTTLYLSPDLARFDPRFGSDSRAAHLAAGGVDLSDSAPPAARRDVDTPSDLRAALLIGTGPRTARTAAQLGIG
ncbi:MAG: 2-phospho-L-lactate/phosphoenolpyruvate guanylyltransferase [Nocardioidaceae bacterium]|nr:2-phospho-L-lactate/phosphoenolpyruvate guanylyltransferase [Nocardioidaceae bacterium]